MNEAIIPSTSKQSFSCPHCHAIAHQDWFEAFAHRIVSDEVPIPRQFDPQKLDQIESEYRPDSDAPNPETFLTNARRSVAGEVFLWPGEHEKYVKGIENIHLSQCFSCKKYTLWLGHKQVWPAPAFEIIGASNMPDSVRQDFDEARSVFEVSPRAASALLRVAIERLCNEITGSTAPVFENIGNLVKDGLDNRIQKALDIVRVTGNDAVHPGQIDRADSRETAITLFKLVNLIVEKMITEPQQIDALFGQISPQKRAAIERRDQPKK